MVRSILSVVAETERLAETGAARDGGGADDGCGDDDDEPQCQERDGDPVDLQ
jgi:hypothetical protein